MQHPTPSMQTVQKKLRQGGIILFSYAITYPALPNDAFCAHYATLCEKLTASLEANGIAIGQKALQAFLANGGKKSRFRCPQYCLQSDCRWEKNSLAVTLTATLTQGKEIAFSKITSQIWDFSYRTPTCKRRKARALADACKHLDVAR